MFDIQHEGYGVVLGKSHHLSAALEDLSIQVQRQMETGWAPQGGIAYLGTFGSGGGTYHIFVQAVVKPVQEEQP
jgi:hypothetical protein